MSDINPQRETVLSALLREIQEIKEIVNQQQYDQELIDRRFRDAGEIVQATGRAISKATKAGR